MNTLLDIRGSRYRCTPRNRCNEVVSQFGMCASRSWCLRAYYLSSRNSGDYCVAPWYVMGEKFCYTTTKECSTLRPITESNGFVDYYKTENKYTCRSGRILKITETTAECVPEEECDRTQEGVNGKICYGSVCPEDLAYDEGKKLCVASCGKKLKYRPGGETLCQDACPGGVPYVFKGWCRERCPAGSFTVPGNFTCETPTFSALIWK